MTQVGRVKYATAYRLVERLVFPTRFDAKGKFSHRYCTALLLTYRAFYTPQLLLQTLQELFSMPQLAT